ncbi:MAG TPA: thiol-disulfide oxidoreductase DCC family protein [Chitinophagaceae bacterium]|jgi:predicted DCC family thiol-disulfide oxidoreductase YuxK|nr:thiol-disulfide oxidoreductase DCC family protein [Chitinophagaceae bacterium]
MKGDNLPAQRPVILFDGVCNYCNALTNFIIRQDKKKIFLFATLQSNFGVKILRDKNLPTDEYESLLLIDKGKLYSKSNAGLRIYNKLPWYWKWTQLFWIFPKFFRDWVYSIIAKNRYKWFGKRETCMVPTPELKTRFLD